MEKQRDLSFDFIKGVLIFLVVYGHCLNQLHVRHTEGMVDVWIYSFHMPMFMFVSGYFAAHTLKNGVGTTWKKISLRLLIPAIVWSIVVFCEKLLYGAAVSVRLFYDSCRGTWFLWSLLGLYMLASLVWRTKKKWLWISCISIVLYALWPYYPVDVLKHFKIIEFFPVFCIGGLCYGKITPPYMYWLKPTV